MAKYYIKHGGETFIPVPYDTKKKAASALIEMIACAMKLGNNDPTKFRIEEVEDEEKPLDAAEITDFDKAREYLGLDGETTLRLPVLDGQDKTVTAFLMLDTFCQAWNKADGFEPVGNTRRWTPALCSDGSLSAVECSTTYHNLFTFKTKERARQFGEKFIDLFRQLYGIG